MRLDDETTGKGLQLAPDSYGMDVSIACTIVMIAGSPKLKRPQEINSHVQVITLTKWTGL